MVVVVQPPWLGEESGLLVEGTGKGHVLCNSHVKDKQHAACDLIPSNRLSSFLLGWTLRPLRSRHMDAKALQQTGEMGKWALFVMLITKAYYSTLLTRNFRNSLMFCQLFL